MPTAPAEDAAARTDAVFAAYGRSTPGAAVAVVKDGEAVFVRGYGLADLEHAAAVTPATPFYLASVSKQFTAMAALMLARERRIDLAAPVSDVIPELPKHAAAVNLYHLLTHTSGLRDYFALGWLAGWGLEAVYSEQRVLGLLGRQARLNFTPGERQLYSNSGYVLASIYVHRVSGQRLDAFARERIFAPLGMSTARFQHDHAALVPGKAFGYVRRDDVWVASNSLLDVVGDGGMYGSVNDLARWLANLQSPSVGGAELEQMQEPARLADGRRAPGGMGLGTGEHRGLVTVGHSGGLAGYRTNLVWLPSERLGVVVLCNDGAAMAPALSRQVVEAWLPEGRMAPVPTLPAESIADFSARAGLYRWAAGGYFHLALGQKGRTLVMDGSQVLAPTSSGEFRGEALALCFDGVDAGEAGPLAGPMARFARAAPPALTDAGLDVYAGRYWSDELVAAHVIRRSGDGLTLQVADEAPLRLVPANPDELLVAPFNICLVFERDGAGAVTGFSIDDQRVKGVRLRRA